MEASIRINLSDLTEFRLFNHAGRAARLKRLVFVVFAPLLVIGGLLGLFPGAKQAAENSNYWLPVIALVAACSWLLSILSRLHLRKQAKDELKSQGSSSFLEEFRITLKAEGVLVEKAIGSQEHISWARIQKVLCNHDYCYLYLNSEDALILPRKCFSDDAYFAAFAKTAITYHWAADSATVWSGQKGSSITRQTPALPLSPTPPLSLRTVDPGRIRLREDLPDMR